MTKPRLLIEIVSETPCWLFREKAVCKACAWSCVQRGLIQLLLRPPFLSCNKTSVHSCGQTTVESTGCTHVSWVRGVALAVYILAQVCAVFPPDWYMSFEHSSHSSFSEHLRVFFFLLWGTRDETAVYGSVCVSTYKTGYISEQAALMLFQAHATFRFDVAGQAERARSACAAAWWEFRHLPWLWWIACTCTIHGNQGRWDDWRGLGMQGSVQLWKWRDLTCLKMWSVKKLWTSHLAIICMRILTRAIWNVSFTDVQQAFGGIWLNTRGLEIIFYMV